MSYDQMSLGLTVIINHNITEETFTFCCQEAISLMIEIIIP